MNPVVWETSGILSSLSWVNSILGQALTTETQRTQREDLMKDEKQETENEE
jgi:hypothetical protein